MKLLRYVSIAFGLALMGAPEADAQESPSVKVDPGVSVHNYKHPNKAAKARKAEVKQSRKYSKRVGIVQRSTNTVAPRAPHETPRYARRPGLVFFRRSWRKPPTLNPLANPNHYKVNAGN